MSSHWKVVLGLLVGSWVLYNFVHMRPYHGVDAAEPDATAEPFQEELDQPKMVGFVRGGRRYVARLHHEYEIQGRVLMASSYWVFYRSDLMVVDVGLAWGERLDWMMQTLHFNQGGRWLFWQSDGPMSKQDVLYVKSHISNNHLIPAMFDWNLEKAIRWIREDDVVRLKGYLVTIETPEGKVILDSSTSRTDTGAGACEVIWVEEVQIGDTVYGPSG